VSNYPPGVTGREWEIAGPDSEVEEERVCPACSYPENWVEIDDFEPPTVEGWHYRFNGSEWWECQECGYQEDIDDYPGPD